MGMTAKKLTIHKGDIPMGYSFVGIFDERQKADRWYAAAVKAKDTKPYLLTCTDGLYHLWVFKRKGEGKMVGKGFDPSNMRSIRNDRS